MAAKQAPGSSAAKWPGPKPGGGWSTSARWEGCTRATATPRIRHVLRDVEERAGKYRPHSNELIDASLTDTNLSFRPVLNEDGSIGKEPIQSADEVFDALNERIALAQRWRVVPEFRSVIEKDAAGNKIVERDEAGEPVLDKKGKPVYRRRQEPMPSAGEKVPIALRKDTVVAVEELFQLDPLYTGPIADMTPEMRAEVQRLYDVWYDDLIDQYGVENVILIGEHWDETSPHVSAFCVPLDESTGELNAKLFLTGKKKPTRTEARDAYVAKHDRLRASLREAGYEATFERVTPRNAQGQPGEGQPLENFKRAADRATKEQREDLDARARDLDAQTVEFGELATTKVAELDSRAGQLAELQDVLLDRHREIEANEARLDAQVDANNAAVAENRAYFDGLRTEIVARETAVSGREVKLTLRESEVSARETTVSRRESEVETEKRRGYDDGVSQGAAAWERLHGADHRRKVRREVTLEVETETRADRDAATADRKSAADALSAAQTSLRSQRAAERKAVEDAEAAESLKQKNLARAKTLDQREAKIEGIRVNLERVRLSLEARRADLLAGTKAVVAVFKSVPTAQWTPGMVRGFTRFNEEQVTLSDTLLSGIEEVLQAPAPDADGDYGD